MEPLLVDLTGRAREGLDDLALELEREAASLAGYLAPSTREAVVDFLRIANSYYSNRIEGHDTRPGSIERAMRDEFASDPNVSALQREARAHGARQFARRGSPREPGASCSGRYSPRAF